MPSCPDCGAETLLAQGQNGESLILDTKNTRSSGLGRWRVVNWRTRPPQAVRVSKAWNAHEAVEHSRVCRQPYVA